MEVELRPQKIVLWARNGTNVRIKWGPPGKGKHEPTKGREPGNEWNWEEGERGEAGTIRNVVDLKGRTVRRGGSSYQEEREKRTHCPNAISTNGGLGRERNDTITRKTNKSKNKNPRRPEKKGRARKQGRVGASKEVLGGARV